MGGGHTTNAPASITYSSVVSRDSVLIKLTISAMNGLDIFACDIKNVYLTAKWREIIWTTAGPEFSLEEGSIMVVKMALYILKSSGAVFRSKLAILLHNIGYNPSKEYLDVWMRTAIKSDGTEYYKYTMVYFDYVLVNSCVPMKTIAGIKFIFKLNGDKSEPPNMYLQQFKTKGGTKCL